MGRVEWGGILRLCGGWMGWDGIGGEFVLTAKAVAFQCGASTAANTEVTEAHRTRRRGRHGVNGGGGCL